MQRWVLLFVLVVWLGVAYAKPRVAVAPIDGDESGDMRDAVADALDGGELDVISTGKVTKAIDRLGYDNDLSAKQAKKVGREVEADAIVLAKLGKSGKHKTLKIRIYVGGKKVRGFKVTFNNEKSSKFKSKLRDKVTERLEGTLDDDEETADNEDEDGGKKKKKKKKKKLARDGDDEDPDRDPDDDPEIDAAVARVSKRSANRLAARIDVGISVQNRRLTFTQRSNFPEGPKPYSNTYVPGARFEGELYPFVLMNPKSLLASTVGFAAEYDRTVSLNLRTSREPNIPVPTAQYHWSVGGRFRIPFGSKPTSPAVTLGFDYGKRAFRPDRSQLMSASSLDVPNTAYMSLQPGLAIRIPVAPQFAFVGSSKAMLIRDAGPIQALDQYGRAKVFGVTAQAGFDIVLGNRFAIRVVGEFAQVGFTFVGNGFRTNSLDGDPDTKDIGGALDRSIGGAATLAVLY